jgi:hypothetical protein
LRRSPIRHLLFISSFILAEGMVVHRLDRWLAFTALHRRGCRAGFDWSWPTQALPASSRCG